MSEYTTEVIERAQAWIDEVERRRLLAPIAEHLNIGLVLTLCSHGKITTTCGCGEEDWPFEETLKALGLEALPIVAKIDYIDGNPYHETNEYI